MGHAGPGPDNCKALCLDDNEHRGYHKPGELVGLHVPKTGNDTCLIYHLCFPFGSSVDFVDRVCKASQLENVSQ